MVPSTCPASMETAERRYPEPQRMPRRANGPPALPHLILLSFLSHHYPDHFISQSNNNNNNNNNNSNLFFVVASISF
ncbi:hypothetical protein HZ326_2255 [Fusarium oxysporum f. sp. albedinis]|nr:hypothetical protein HZ326_2255 [Fusarium oxysporum f. sp. albedinis]